MSQTHTRVQLDLFRWFDEVLSGVIPNSTVAFHVNFYEAEDAVLVELMGTASFLPGTNPETDYWPGEATFRSGSRFEVPFDVAGAAWPEWLATTNEMVRAYIRDGGHAARLRSSAGVGSGFVDGDMDVLWLAPQA